MQKQPPKQSLNPLPKSVPRSLSVWGFQDDSGTASTALAPKWQKQQPGGQEDPGTVGENNHFTVGLSHIMLYPTDNCLSGAQSKSSSNTRKPLALVHVCLVVFFLVDPFYHCCLGRISFLPISSMGGRPPPVEISPPLCAQVERHFLPKSSDQAVRRNGA